ncbi:MAG: hypothetical protein DWI60_02230 [Chloroflexi bacterium]|nr:MAG: hypothetical protein DWI60_02230 [Chloroflexota bacterium]
MAATASINILTFFRFSIDPTVKIYGFRDSLERKTGPLATYRGSGASWITRIRSGSASVMSSKSSAVTWEGQMMRSAVRAVR